MRSLQEFRNRGGHNQSPPDSSSADAFFLDETLERVREVRQAAQLYPVSQPHGIAFKSVKRRPSPGGNEVQTVKSVCLDVRPSQQSAKAVLRPSRSKLPDNRLRDRPCHANPNADNGFAVCAQYRSQSPREPTYCIIGKKILNFMHQVLT